MTLLRQRMLEELQHRNYVAGNPTQLPMVPFRDRNPTCPVSRLTWRLSVWDAEKLGL